MILQYVSMDSLAFRLPKVRCTLFCLSCYLLRGRVRVARECVQFCFSVVNNENSKIIISSHWSWEVGPFSTLHGPEIKGKFLGSFD